MTKKEHKTLHDRENVNTQKKINGGKKATAVKKQIIQRSYLEKVAATHCLDSV